MKRIFFLFLFKLLILLAQGQDVLKHSKGLVAGNVDTVRVLYLANKLAECTDPDSKVAIHTMIRYWQRDCRDFARIRQILWRESNTFLL